MAGKGSGGRHLGACRCRRFGRATMFKHILIATDGSELASKAVENGFALAKVLHAKATAITVTEA